MNNSLAISSGQPEGNQEASPRISRRQAVEISSSTGMNTSRRSATVSAEDMYADLERQGGIVATAHTKTGMPVSHDRITDDSIVYVKGREVSVRSALSAGYLVRDADGSLREPWQKAKANPAPEPKAEPTDQTGDDDQPDVGPSDDELEGLGDDELEGLISTVADAAPQQDVISVINAASSGEDLPDQALNQIADSMGLSRDEALEQYETIRSAFEDQASRAVEEATGLDAEAVFEWAREHASSELAGAIRSQAMNRSTAGYQELARQYVENLDSIDPDALLSAQYPEGVRAVQRDGRVVIETPQGAIPWRLAVRKGIAKVSRG
jgi:hypothetical protein